MRAHRINLSEPGLLHVTPSTLPRVARLCLPWRMSIPVHAHILFPVSVFLSLRLVCCTAVLSFPSHPTMHVFFSWTYTEACVFMTLSFYYWIDVFIWRLCFFLQFVLKLCLFLSNVSKAAPACCWLSFVKNCLHFLSVCLCQGKWVSCWQYIIEPLPLSTFSWSNSFSWGLQLFSFKVIFDS